MNREQLIEQIITAEIVTDLLSEESAGERRMALFNLTDNDLNDIFHDVTSYDEELHDDSNDSW